jgi:MFS family permease
LKDPTVAKQEPRIPIPPLIRRNTLYLASAQAFVGAGFSLVPTLGAIIIFRLMGSASLAGLATSMLGVSRLLVSYPIGKLTDVYGRKVGVILGLLVGIVGAIILSLSVLSSSFLLFLLGLLVFGLGMSAAQQLRVAAADMYPRSRRAEGMAYVLTGSVVGVFGGPLIINAAEALSPHVGIPPISLAWTLVPVIIVPSVFMVLRVHPDPAEIASHLERYYVGYRPEELEPAAHPGARVRPATFIRDYPKLTVYVANFAVQGNMSMMMAMTSLVLAISGHSLTAISFSVAIHALGMFAFSLPLGRLSDSVGRRPVLLAGIAIAGAGAILTPITSLYWVITAGTFLVGLGWSCVNVAGSALIADTTPPRQRGRAIGANDTFGAASAFSLPLIGGPVMEFLGLTPLGLLGMAMMIVPAILVLRLRESSPGHYG